MKKMLSILLALLMALSLAAPALAAENGPPASGAPSAGGPHDADSSWTIEDEWAALCRDKSGETAQFLEELPAWFAEEYSWYEGSFEQFSHSFFQGREAAYVALFKEWSYDPAQQWAALCAEQPERTAQFLKELPAWFAENYPDENLAEYVTFYACPEELYLELYDSWSWDYEREQEIKDFITARGGVPGQINVMVNGTYVRFTGAAPEISGGRTMTPVRAMAEALGGEVDYAGNEDIRCTVGKFVYTFAVGKNTVTVRPTAAAGQDMPQPEDIVMDCAPYIKDGHTYIPLRFFAQALGYDVQWDSHYRSAVITDLNALAEQIDKDFTIYNKLAAKGVLTGTAQRSAGSGKAAVTLFDTLNGDETGKGTWVYDLTASTAGASGKIEYDFSALWSLIEGYIPMPLSEDSYAAEEGLLPPDGYAGQYAKSLELVKSLMKGSAEIRMDLKKGKVYLSMPGLFEAMAGYMEDAGVQLPKGAWLSASLADGTELDGLVGMMGQPLTIGRLLSTVSGGASVSGAYSAQSYENTLEAAAQLGKLCGDAKFTRKGGADVLTLTKADLEALGEDDRYTAGSLDALSKFDFTLTVKDNGEASVNYQARVALRSSGIDLGDFVDVSVNGSTRGGRSESTMDLHIKNVLKATVTLRETVTETDKAPELAPPKDALVLPVDGTLPGSTISSPDGMLQLRP